MVAITTVRNTGNPRNSLAEHRRLRPSATTPASCETPEVSVVENMLLLTVPQAARLLGMSPRRLYALVAQGAFPEGITIRLGRAVRLSGPRLRRWLGATGADTGKVTPPGTCSPIESSSI